MRASTILVSVLTIAATAAGCSGTSSSGPAKPQSSATLSPSASPSTSTTGATDLTLTADVRAQLIHAQALVVRVPDSAFVRLAKGTAYYALDNETGIHWAGASLVPSHSSIRAQVSVQDDGSYILFEQKPGEAWTTYDVGLAALPDALPCPVSVPNDVTAVWHWATNSCNPYMKASTPTPSVSPTSGATNLSLTQDIRQQLVHAKAVEVKVPDSAFTGLAKGTAYYAVDNSTGIYWAGASVVPSQSSERALVSSQDEGGYNIFELQPGGTWQIFDAGLDGPDPRAGGQCPVQIPADILAVWHWAPNTCDPPTHA